jgi:hypothetical protein
MKILHTLISSFLILLVAFAMTLADVRLDVILLAVVVTAAIAGYLFTTWIVMTMTLVVSVSIGIGLLVWHDFWHPDLSTVSGRIDVVFIVVGALLFALAVGCGWAFGMTKKRQHDRRQEPDLDASLTEYPGEGT